MNLLHRPCQPRYRLGPCNSATGGISVVGVFIPEDPGAADELAKQGKMAFDFGAFWFKGQQIRTGQANVKTYNRRLRDLIHVGKAKPSCIISHRLGLDQAPDAYKHFGGLCCKPWLRA